MERGAKLFLEGILKEVEPTVKDLQGMIDEMEPALKEFVDTDERIANLVFYYKDHQGETIRRAIHTAKQWIEEHGNDVEGLTIRLAGGTIGVTAASGTMAQALGAPNLTDGIWLHGARLEDIETTIREGRSGRMPPHDSVLSEERLHVLAAYVYGLSQP